METISPLTTVPTVYLEIETYVVLEEDMQVEIVIVRDGNISDVTNVLFTTTEDTASGNFARSGQ